MVKSFADCVHEYGIPDAKWTLITDTNRPFNDDSWAATMHIVLFQAELKNIFAIS